MTDEFQQTAEQAAAFQKIWMESLSKTMQAAWSSTPDAPPSEMMREIRATMLEGLAKSWDQFLRSPEFLEVMRRWMDEVVSLRKMTNDFIAKARKEFQAPSTEDIENVVLAVRHMEKRVLDRLEDLSLQFAALKTAASATSPTPRSRGARKAAAPGKTFRARSENSRKTSRTGK